MSLAGGFVHLRYSLGDGTMVLQSPKRLDIVGEAWHKVMAGRDGNQGYLDVDGYGMTRSASSAGMTCLDVTTEIFVGGFPDLGSVCPGALEEGMAVGFTGSVREVIVNGNELELTERGALRGMNVGDWDGTACGYRVCQNGGTCQPGIGWAVKCVCPQGWMGQWCERSVYCEGALCQGGSVCVPAVRAAAYSCVCALGWQGEYCDKRVTITTAYFVGNSYLKFQDPKYELRTLTSNDISFRLSACSGEGLILWMGRAVTEDDDYLAVGLQGGRLKVALNLGERVAFPIVMETSESLCCHRWSNVTISRQRTVIRVTVDGKILAFRDIDPYEHYVAVDYRGIIYLGGFELGRDIATVTGGLFGTGLDGHIRDVVLYGDTGMTELLHNAQGFNVFQDEI